jgi:hypothetical protein
MTTRADPPTHADPGAGDELADLEALATALGIRGYQADLMRPRPYLAVRPPGALVPRPVYAAGWHFYLPSAEPVGSRAEIGLAADVIAWVLGGRPSPTRT